MKGRSTESTRLLSCSPIPKMRLAARRRSARSFALISAFRMGKFFLIIPTAGKSRLRSSCKKCIWTSNPLWCVPQKPSTACLLSYPWLISIVLFDASRSLSAAIRRFRTLLCSFLFCSFRISCSTSRAGLTEITFYQCWPTSHWAAISHSWQTAD